MLNKKYLREGRMGPPFSYKTGAVVETYPKPLLILEFDPSGLDVVKQPIERIKYTQLSEYCKKPQAELPPVLAIEFQEVEKKVFSLNMDSHSAVTANVILEVVNKLVTEGCPWKTVVVDPITGLTNAFIGYIGINDPKAMLDARKWAYMVGVLIERVIMVVQGLPCHSVFIIHCQTDKNEVTGEIITEPMVPSSFRQRLPGIFSQFFYAAIEGGKPVVYAQPTGFIKGLGMRAPKASPDKTGANFRDIYGSEYE
jgi:hypothetical protein